MPEDALMTSYVDIKVDLNKLQDQLNQLETKVTKTSTTFENKFNGLTRVVGTLGTALASLGIARLGAEFIGAATKMDSLRRALATTETTAAGVKMRMKELQEVAKLPGLGLPEAIQGFTNLRAVGMQADLSKRSLMAFGNALASVGKGRVELDGVILALTQISTKGKVTAEEINQIAERVPQIRKVMLDAFGTASTEAIQKMGISADEFISKVVTSLEKLPKVSGGAQNAFENFNDALFQFKVAMSESVLPLISQFITKVTGMIEKFNALPDATKNAIGKAVMGGVGIAGFGVALSSVAIALPAVVSGINSLKAAILALQAGGALGILSKVGAGLALIAPFTLSGNAPTGKENALEISIKRLEDAITEAEKGGMYAEDVKIKDIKNAPYVKKYWESIPSLKEGAGNWIGPNRSAVSLLEDLNNELDALHHKSGGAGRSFEVLKNDIDNAGDDVDSLTTKLRDLNIEFLNLSTAQGYRATGKPEIPALPGMTSLADYQAVNAQNAQMQAVYDAMKKSGAPTTFTDTTTMKPGASFKGLQADRSFLTVGAGDAATAAYEQAKGVVDATSKVQKEAADEAAKNSRQLAEAIRNQWGWVATDLENRFDAAWYKIWDGSSRTWKQMFQDLLKDWGLTLVKMQIKAQGTNLLNDIKIGRGSSETAKTLAGTAVTSAGSNNMVVEGLLAQGLYGYGIGKTQWAQKHDVLAGLASFFVGGPVGLLGYGIGKWTTKPDNPYKQTQYSTTPTYGTGGGENSGSANLAPGAIVVNNTFPNVNPENMDKARFARMVENSIIDLVGSGRLNRSIIYG